MKRFHTFLFAAVALMLSCGYASASHEPQHFTLSHTASHFYVSPGEPVSVRVARELAQIDWQHAVARESRIARSDMHASGAGLVFTAIHAEPDAGSDSAA